MPEMPDLTINGTTYRPIAEAPGYAVSRSGDVASNRGRGALIGSDGLLWGVLRQSFSSSGYCKVNLHVDGAAKTYVVHRLVLFAWIGPPTPEKPECRHLDGNKEHNHADNLAWGSSADNSADQAAHGTTAKGDMIGTSKLTEDSVREARRMAALGISQEVIARKFGVTRRAVGYVVSRQAWGWLT